MKANEIMVGDLILVNNRPTRVYGIMERQGRIYDTMTNDISLKRCDPMPLTPKILEKNGFDVSDPEVSIYRFEEDGQAFRFCLRRMYDKDNHPNEYSFYAFNVLAIIDSVHQLQHALRLCGIDKNIEI